MHDRYPLYDRPTEVNADKSYKQKSAAFECNEVMVKKKMRSVFQFSAETFTWFTNASSFRISTCV